jgi:hypothetical protein
VRRRVPSEPSDERLGTLGKIHYCFAIFLRAAAMNCNRLCLLGSIFRGKVLSAILGAMMTTLFRALAVAVVAGGLFGTAALAQTQLTESPVTPGFWSFPTKKVAAAPDIVALCRNHFEIRFADGHFIGLRLQRRDVGLVQREIEKVGRCSFNRATQTDSCEMKHIHSDGSILAGTAEIKYSLDGQKISKMMVTPKMITDSPVDNAPFDAFPVRCPDDAVWNILNETSLPK